MSYPFLGLVLLGLALLAPYLLEIGRFFLPDNLVYLK